MYNRTPLIHTFLEKNRHINLSAIRDAEGVNIKHIQDALEMNKIITFPSGAHVADLGTGGGFPLLPLAITNPDVQFTGIDSVKKKTVAVNEMIAALHIKNATVVWSRIEAYTSQTFDYLTARAVAYVDTLIAWSYPLVKKGGIFLLMKQSLPEERKVLLKACHQRKLHLLKEHTYTLFPGDIERVIYVIQKT